MTTKEQDTTHPIVLPVKPGPIGAFIRDANDVMIASTVNADVAHQMIQAVNAHDRLIATLRELWNLALVQREFTGFCDEVVVKSRDAINAALAGRTPPETLEQRYADLRYAAGRVIRAYTMSDEQAGISGQDELNYAITDVLAGALAALVAGGTGEAV